MVDDLYDDSELAAGWAVVDEHHPSDFNVSLEGRSLAGSLNLSIWHRFPLGSCQSTCVAADILREYKGMEDAKGLSLSTRCWPVVRSSP